MQRLGGHSVTKQLCFWNASEWIDLLALQPLVVQDEIYRSIRFEAKSPVWPEHSTLSQFELSILLEAEKGEADE